MNKRETILDVEEDLERVRQAQQARQAARPYNPGPRQAHAPGAPAPRFFEVYVDDEPGAVFSSVALDFEGAVGRIKATAPDLLRRSRRLFVDFADGERREVKPEVRPIGILDVWDAGRVRRWHTHPHLAGTDDRTDGHSARVALIALTLDPSLSREGLIFALAHDAGERAIGDVSGPAKRRFPDLAATVDAIERGEIVRLGLRVEVSEREEQIVKLADSLDSWLWMIRHNPALRHRKGWQDQAHYDLAAARSLGVAEKVEALFVEVDDLLSQGIPA